MNSNDNNLPEPESQVVDPLERFLDGQMSPQEAKQFLEQTDSKGQLEHEQLLESEMKSSLTRMFARTSEEDGRLVDMAKAMAIEPTEVSKPLIESGEERNADNSPVASSSNERSFVRGLLSNRLFQAAIAASLLVALLLNWDLLGDPNGAVDFQPRRLASLYKESQAHGFRPYYNCEDPIRFGDTFEKRQGQRLSLAEMPEGIKMLGLSYLGGISQDTTAMLGEVQGKQVIVFVDNASKKDVLDAISESSDPNLRVFVREERGLIFAEVTPHSEPALMDFFEFGDQVSPNSP